MDEPWADGPDGLSPGRPRAEHVLFVVLGALVALLALSRMFALL